MPNRNNGDFDFLRHRKPFQERPRAVIPGKKQRELPRGLAPRLCGSPLGYAHGYHGPGPVCRKPSSESRVRVLTPLGSMMNRPPRESIVFSSELSTDASTDFRARALFPRAFPPLQTEPHSAGFNSVPLRRVSTSGRWLTRPAGLGRCGLPTHSGTGAASALQTAPVQPRSLAITAGAMLCSWKCERWDNRLLRQVVSPNVGRVHYYSTCPCPTWDNLILSHLVPPCPTFTF